MQVHSYVKSLDVKSNETYRGLCPGCGRPNTFTATNCNGTIKYNCYSASCNVAGSVYKGATVDDLVRTLRADLTSPDHSPVGFEPPEHFVLVPDEGLARDFMGRYDLDKLDIDGRIAIRYDPKLDRIVFLIDDPTTGMTVDAVGRALQPGVKPKWHRYGKHKDAVFVVTPESTSLDMRTTSLDCATTAVIVEDAVSACTVSAIANGIAILGTNPPQGLCTLLKDMGILRTFVALDPDAAAKAIDIQRELCYYFDTRVWLIKDDLKYYTKDRLIEEVGELLK